MAAAALNIIGNTHLHAQDGPSSVKGMNILTSSFSNSNGRISSYHNNSSDYFGSSIPKSSNSNSVHIGSLTGGLSGLSLAAQSYHPGTPTSSLSSGLYSYNTSSNSPITVNGSNGINSGNATNGNQQEEISTIFVVGFPDDMQEREFQNMFVFTPGFEAATLKIPNKDQQDDDALTLGVNGVNPRKQIIGFAKFRTHQEAQQAITVLSGRRVDAEKGSLLKAEMAKKNLHTRRGLSNEMATNTIASSIPSTSNS
ncbi:hypothetical protein BGZ76_003760, partial [Entomortierella beljakovae]